MEGRHFIYSVAPVTLGASPDGAAMANSSPAPIDDPKDH